MTLPLASVLQVEGPQVPRTPPFWPVTVKVTSWPALAVPPLVTWAVTVCLVPAAPEPWSGVRLMSGEVLDTPTPAMST